MKCVSYTLATEVPVLTYLISVPSAVRTLPVPHPLRLAAPTSVTRWRRHGHCDQVAAVHLCGDVRLGGQASHGQIHVQGSDAHGHLGKFNVAVQLCTKYPIGDIRQLQA